MSIRILHGDCREVLRSLSGIHACVTDPPYHLTSIVKRFGADGAAPAQYGRDGAYARASAGFMGQKWDGGDVAFQADTWRLVFNALLPGAHLVAFGGTRTYHRMACAIEDAGFEIRDTLCWLYGSGFPKSHDISKAIDRAAGAEREVVAPPPYTRGKAGLSYSDTRRVSYDYDPLPITAPATPEAAAWAGWGTALKPAFEPIILARKPLDRGATVAGNVLAHGTGAINIDACRITAPDGVSGRWPANVLHDGSDEVEAAFAAFGEREARGGGDKLRSAKHGVCYGAPTGGQDKVVRNDSGSASRFFYSAKADASDRQGSRHPTVKPTDLMRWLVRLVTPPGGTVLDPFAGTGSTGLAADQCGFNAVLIEQDATYCADMRRKLLSDAPLFTELT